MPEGVHGLDEGGSFLCLGMGGEFQKSGLRLKQENPVVFPQPGGNDRVHPNDLAGAKPQQAPAYPEAVGSDAHELRG
jgi:hypothetical protein